MRAFLFTLCFQNKDESHEHFLSHSSDVSYHSVDHFSRTLYNKVTVSDKIQSIVHLSHSSMRWRWKLIAVTYLVTWWQLGDNLVTTTWGLCVCRLCKKPQSVGSAHAHALVTWWLSDLMTPTWWLCAWQGQPPIWTQCNGLLLGPQLGDLLTWCLYSDGFVPNQVSN